MEDSSARLPDWTGTYRSRRTALSLLLLILGSVLFMLPLIWMISTSLKPQDQLFLFPPQWIPRPIEWDNYAEAWSQGELWVYTQNTTLVVILNIIGNIFGSSLPAFAFARLRFPGRRILFLIMLSTMMVPIWVTIVPTFLLFKFLAGMARFGP